MSQDPARVRACYDTVASDYAARYRNELDGKPFDREALIRFARELEGKGRILDLGCGCGHVTKFLADQGADVFGIDLSPGQLAQGAEYYPDMELREGNMLELDLPSSSIAGVVALYSIVHFTRDQLATAAAEMFRVLAPDGPLLLSFHIGTETLELDEFLDREVPIDFMFFPIKDVLAVLKSAGFVESLVERRDPYPDVESQTNRAYIRARKPAV